MDPIFEMARIKNKELYSDPNSIAYEFDTILHNKGFYHSMNTAILKKCLKGHYELFDEILNLYYKAKYENEKIAMMEYLVAIGYNKDKLVELILDVYNSDNHPENLWEYGSLLYSLKNFHYLQQYFFIVKNTSLGSDRQMVVLLIGKSKNPEVVPILKSLVNDQTVCGHALEALSNFIGNDIVQIMNKYTNCEISWIRNIAVKYLKKHS